MDGEGLHARLRAAVAALAPRQRAMVVLRYYADCTLDEIAATMGCRPGTVRATLHQALKRLHASTLDKQDKQHVLLLGTMAGGEITDDAR